MRRLVMFGRRPRLGKVKTRLMPHLDAEQALELYRAFLHDQIEFLRSFSPRYDVELAMDGPWEPGEGDADVADIRVTDQGPGDLGRRMHRVFERARKDGSSATVLLGTDAPTLPASHVEDAFRRLAAGAPVVVVPAEDGGYVLVGLREPRAELFRDVPWGSPDVLRTTVERGRQIGLALSLLPPWYDVDDAVGLRRLCSDPALAPDSRRAPGTAAVLDSLGLRVI